MNVIHEAARRTSKRREARTETILDAAMLLLGRDGVDGLTLQAVAAELGLVTTALYRYFPSKNALLAALQRRTVTALHARLRALLDDLERAHANEPPRVRALLPIVALPAFYEGSRRAMPEAFRLLMTMLGDPRLMLGDEDALRTAPLLGAMLSDVGGLFTHAVKTGALPPGDVVEQTLIVWSLLQGTTALGKLGRFNPRLGESDALATAALSALLRGWGADAQILARARSLGFPAAAPAPSSPRAPKPRSSRKQS